MTTLSKQNKFLTILFLLLLIPFSASQTYAQKGDKIAAPFLRNVVHITVILSNDQSQDGFGFVVGEKWNQLYVATANHVIYNDDDPDVTTKEILVKFHDDQLESVRAEPQNLASSFWDVALLKVPKPSWYKWEKNVLSLDYKKNEQAWFIGLGKRWDVPPDRVAGTLAYDKDASRDLITFYITIVERGTSGAPLFTENGIVGMVTKDASYKAHAVPIDRIKRLIEEKCRTCWGLQEFGTQRITPVAVAKSEKGKLFVNVEPENAAIRVLNIREKFDQGMELEPGKYQIEASAENYETQTTWVTVNTGDDARPNIRLEPVSKTSLITNSIGMKFVFIAPGTFMMGSPENEPSRDSDEKQHKVTLTQGFYMQTTEVTQGQWKAIMGSNPSRFKDCGNECPVEQVSWDDTQEFIKKLNRKEGKEYRLPTEAEWEYSCRAGTTTPFSFGKCLSTDQANYDGNYPLEGCSKGKYRKKTMPAASFAPNQWDIYDMHGNVWEWCSDWYGDYPAFAVINPTGPDTGSNRVNRGGSYFIGARFCRSAIRDYYSPDYRPLRLGFRVLREAP